MSLRHRPMRRNRLQAFDLYPRSVKKDSEGGTYETYGDAQELTGEVWPAGGKVQAQMYGERLSYIRNVKIQGSYEVAEEDGHVVYQFDGFTVSELDGLRLEASTGPDYRIISITPSRPLRLEAEKI